MLTPFWSQAFDKPCKQPEGDPRVDYFMGCAAKTSANMATSHIVPTIQNAIERDVASLGEKPASCKKKPRAMPGL